MQGTVRSLWPILSGFILVLLSGGTALIYSGDSDKQTSAKENRLPVFMAHLGGSSKLDRPPVVFDHERHTAGLKQGKSEDCAVCHVMKETDKRLVNPDVKVFKFPKGAFDETDKTAIMYASHAACVSCHRKTAAEGKKAGPDVGLCGQCHQRKPQAERVTWSWSPLFNYARHARHVEAVGKLAAPGSFNVAGKVETVGAVSGKNCELCHHSYDQDQKKLIYKQDSENSCRACHKASDEENSRSIKKVAHSACIGCHMKLAEEVKTELSLQGWTSLTEQDKKRFGPFECQGCHGEHKDLALDEVSKIPRLVRGQKDMMDLVPATLEQTGSATERGTLSAAAVPVRMKAVPFNHKAHEPRAQFCNTCHHHALEKCANCHTTAGDAKKGGGVSYERAFHKSGASQACAGCHAAAKQETKCAGCHQRAADRVSNSSCPVCHRGPTNGKTIDVPPTPLYLDTEKVPEKVQIKTLEKEFKPAEIPHQKIVNKMVTISNESSLARWFHSTQEQTLCAGCHHRGELQQAAAKVPQCISCHNKSFDPAALGKPGIMAAYHQQCIGCHQAVKQKPTALECSKCHPERESLQTAGFIPPIPGRE